MSSIKLTDGEVGTIANALRVSADAFTQNAKVLREGEPHERLAQQFDRQATEARALATRLEEGEAQPDDGISDDRYRERAETLYARAGQLEIDPGADVSRGGDPGAYVQAWVWIAHDDFPSHDPEECETCKAL